MEKIVQLSDSEYEKLFQLANMNEKTNAELKMIYDYYNAKTEILDKTPDENPEKVSKDKN